MAKTISFADGTRTGMKRFLSSLMNLPELNRTFMQATLNLGTYKKVKLEGGKIKFIDVDRHNNVQEVKISRQEFDKIIKFVNEIETGTW